jgi:hypothetical protein
MGQMQEVDWVADALAQTGADERTQQRLIQGWLDDRRAALSFWRFVRRRQGLRAGGYVFVADPAHVEHLLAGDSCSVIEYDRRMHPTSGRFMLGMDNPEHDRNVSLGVVIRSPNLPGQTPDLQALSRVRTVSAQAARAVLFGVASRCILSRLTQPTTECSCSFAALLAPVLDAGLLDAFGIVAPSKGSLLQWAKDITSYHFRVTVREDLDRQRALLAGAQLREHVLQAIMNDQRADSTLNRVVRSLRAAAPGPLTDAEVAVNLVGLMTGALTAPYKTFADGLVLYAEQQVDPHAPLGWPEPAPDALFPWFDAVLASALVAGERAAPDAIYRVYRGKPVRLDSVDVRPDDRIVLWMGGRLPERADDLFGIGMHKCPGMDMGKAMLDGVLAVLTTLSDERIAPRVVSEGREPKLVFAHPELLAQHLAPGS